MRNVHIVTVGFDPHPSLEMLASGEVDHIYLLNDRNEKAAVESEKAIKDILDRFATITYEVVEIDCYDYQDVHTKIMQIADRERDKDGRCAIHINFSRGTAIAVGAACTAACAIRDSDLYYSKWKKGDDMEVSRRIIHVDTSELSVYFQLKGTTKEVFKWFAEADEEGLRNSDLLSYTRLEKNSLTYHTKKLIDLKLIVKTIQGRKVYWKLTETGKIVLKRMTS